MIIHIRHYQLMSNIKLIEYYFDNLFLLDYIIKIQSSIVKLRSIVESVSFIIEILSLSS